METETNPIITPQEPIIQEADPASTNSQAPENKPTAQDGSPLECNICYEESDEPVTTTCGHIYCWACIYKWIDLKANHNHCPVCKNTLAQDKLIPLYPKNYSNDKANDAETKGVPKRPYAKREEAPRYRGFGSSLLTGLNIRTGNVAVTVGCLPTLIPVILMIVLNVFACLFEDSDSDYEVLDSAVNDPSGFENVVHNYETEYETDAFDWTVILIMVLFISLPFILSWIGRRRRNNLQH